MERERRRRKMIVD
jgi:hypothetical protein